MRLELVIIIITGCLIYNTYHDGKYLAMLTKNKKYIQMAFYGIAGVSLFAMLRKNPAQCKKLLLHANDAIKYMPIDKQSADILSPIIDFTTNDTGGQYSFMGNVNPPRSNMEQRILRSGAVTGGGGGGGGGTGGNKGGNGKATKRSVSETKKKYVASMQSWKCGDCKDPLNAWFEIDHKTRLEYGGSNEVGNLVALCRNCHGKKTAFENM